ncbi:hypothetical protein TrLO_g12536 [Triparma laevis f. longispina]|uniref:Uncharacterized protein n=1 Tax=Triparma laevis f. longispina TaxID=1714387 RepID=A0A9W7A6Z9_9STRA|nr:hypothetical protein TrLO_g12536 [Triparma laevis f. longispina]
MSSRYQPRSSPSRSNQSTFYDDDSDFSDDDSFDSLASSNITSVSRNVTTSQRHSLRSSHRNNNNPPSPTYTHQTSLTNATSLTHLHTNKREKLPHSSMNAGNPLEPFCSEFGRQFNENALPICIDQGVIGASKRHIGWSVDILSLNVSHHLPLFMSGLLETSPPYNFLSYEGCLDILLVSGPRGLILPSASKLIPAIKLSLQSGHRDSVSKGLYVLLCLLKCDDTSTGGLGAIPRAIAPYLPRLLPTLNLYIDDDKKIGVNGAYQMAEETLGSVVTRVLETCEELCGGNNWKPVCKVIKYCIPTYSSINAV